MCIILQEFVTLVADRCTSKNRDHKKTEVNINNEEEKEENA